MARMRSALLPVVLLGLGAGCSSYRPIPSTDETVGMRVRLQSGSALAISVPTEGEARRECQVRAVRGLVQDRSDNQVRLMSFRAQPVTGTASRECQRGAEAVLQLPPKPLLVEARRFSLARTLGLGFGIYLGGGLLIAAAMVGGF